MTTPPSPLLRIAHAPAVTVGTDATVSDAVNAMLDNRVGAVVVADEGKLAGIFTERDLMVKVVGPGLNAATVEIREVMEDDPVSVTAATRRSEALGLMMERHFRHLPVVDDDDTVLGMLSIRNLLQHQLDRLKEQMDSLEQYVLADGPGG